MILEKISPTLADSLHQASGDDWVDVILELEAAKAKDFVGSRAEKISKLKDSFVQKAAPLVEQIRGMGGQVDDAHQQAWINGSVRARVLRKMIPALTDQSQVVRVDLPHPIKLES